MPEQTWDQIESSPIYQGLPPGEQMKFKRNYLGQVVGQSPIWHGLPDDQKKAFIGNFLGIQSGDQENPNGVVRIDNPIVGGLAGAAKYLLDDSSPAKAAHTIDRALGGLYDAGARQVGLPTTDQFAQKSGMPNTPMLLPTFVGDNDATSSAIASGQFAASLVDPINRFLIGGAAAHVAPVAGAGVRAALGSIGKGAAQMGATGAVIGAGNSIVGQYGDTGQVNPGAVLQDTVQGGAMGAALGGVGAGIPHLPIPDINLGQSAGNALRRVFNGPPQDPGMAPRVNLMPGEATGAPYVMPDSVRATLDRQDAARQALENPNVPPDQTQTPPLDTPPAPAAPVAPRTYEQHIAGAQDLGFTPEEAHQSAIEQGLQPASGEAASRIPQAAHPDSIPAARVPGEEPIPVTIRAGAEPEQAPIPHAAEAPAIDPARPAAAPLDPAIQAAGEHINFGRLDLDPGEKAHMASLVNEYVAEHGADHKTPVTFEQIRQEAAALDPAMIDHLAQPNAGTTLDPAVRYAARVRLNQTRDQIHDLEAQLQNGALPTETLKALRVEHGALMDRAKRLLDTLLPTRSQDGRNLAFHRMMAGKSFDEQYWTAKARNTAGRNDPAFENRMNEILGVGRVALAREQTARAALSARGIDPANPLKSNPITHAANEAPTAAPTPRPREVAPSAATLEDGTPVYRRAIDPRAIKVSAKDYQFKSGGDEHSGVTDRLKGVSQWDSLAGAKNPVILHERADGTHYVADGHQRVGLAKRLIEQGHDVPDLNALIVREADGVSVADARRVAAMMNIKEGTGTALDAAKVLRGHPMTDAERAQMPMAGTALAKVGEGLSKLGPEAFDHAVEGKTHPDEARNATYSSMVGHALADPAEQMAALRLLQREKPANVTEAHHLIEEVKRAGFSKTATQMDMFGNSIMTDSRLPVRAKILAALESGLKDDRALASNLTRKADKAEAFGNTIDRGANAEQLQSAQGLSRYIDTASRTRGEFSETLNRLADDLSAKRITQQEAVKAAGEALKKDLQGQTSPVADALEQAGQAKLGEARKNQNLGTAGGTGGDLLLGHAQVLAAKMLRGAVDFAGWARDTVAKYGEALAPHLPSIWSKAKDLTGRLAREEDGGLRNPFESWRKFGDPTEGPRGVTHPDPAIQKLLDDHHQAQQAVNASRIALARHFATLDRHGLLQTVSMLRKAGLLTSLRTLTKITVSHVTLQAIEEAARLPSWGIDLAASAVAGGERTVLAPSAGRVWAATKDAFTKGAVESWEILRHGMSDAELAKLNIPGELNSSIPLVGPVISAYVNGVMRVHGAAYHPFKVFAVTKSLHEQARLVAMSEAGVRVGGPFVDAATKAKLEARTAELLKHPTPQMEAEGVAAAEFATFTEENRMAKGISNFKNSQGQMGRFVVDQILPFTHVPANVCVRVLDYAGIGGAARLSKLAWARSKGEIVGSLTSGEQRTIAQALGRGSVGTGLILMGYWLAQKGLATGSYDAKLKDLYQAAGRGFSSIKVGNQWVPIGDLSPLGNLIALGATLHRDKGGLSSVASTAASTVLDQPMMQGVTQVESLHKDPVKGFTKFAADNLASYVPTMVSDITNSHDAKAREISHEGWEALGDAVKAKLPGLRESLPAKIGPFGDEVPNVRGGLGAFNTFAGPTDKTNANPAAAELIRLERERVAGQSQIPLGLPGKNYSLAGQKMSLSPELTHARRVDAGQQVGQLMNAYVSDPGYQGADDDMRRKLLDIALRDGHHTGSAMFLGNHADEIGALLERTINAKNKTTTANQPSQQSTGLRDQLLQRSAGAKF